MTVNRTSREDLGCAGSPPIFYPQPRECWIPVRLPPPGTNYLILIIFMLSQVLEFVGNSATLRRHSGGAFYAETNSCGI
jgi:predicted outer membrane repeat protein